MVGTRSAWHPRLTDPSPSKGKARPARTRGEGGLSKMARARTLTGPVCLHKRHADLREAPR
ncbi:hypothetical protein GCM10009416_50100 [Craurococcus roseus]|uniref:Uncharacterized protein n=1 Tax=Craurococcus roseus TaxID=77585 RepID=A0ABN1GA39_9PROT